MTNYKITLTRNDANQQVPIVLVSNVDYTVFEKGNIDPVTRAIAYDALVKKMQEAKNPPYQGKLEITVKCHKRIYADEGVRKDTPEKIKSDDYDP